MYSHSQHDSKSQAKKWSQQGDMIENCGNPSLLIRLVNVLTATRVKAWVEVEYGWSGLGL